MSSRILSCLSFFFQAEDGIRDGTVTGVQTCALPICLAGPTSRNMPGIIFNPLTKTDLFHHLDIITGPLLNPLLFYGLIMLVKILYPFIELLFYSQDRPFHLGLFCHIMTRWKN